MIARALIRYHEESEGIGNCVLAPSILLAIKQGESSTPTSIGYEPT